MSLIVSSIKKNILNIAENTLSVLFCHYITRIQSTQTLEHMLMILRHCLNRFL